MHPLVAKLLVEAEMVAAVAVAAVAAVEAAEAAEAADERMSKDSENEGGSFKT